MYSIYNYFFAIFFLLFIGANFIGLGFKVYNYFLMFIVSSSYSFAIRLDMSFLCSSSMYLFNLYKIPRGMSLMYLLLIYSLKPKKDSASFFSTIMSS